jgi:hypothetical protein
VIGLTFTEPPAPDPEVARSRIELQLPFRGQWLVFWGGSTPDGGRAWIGTSLRLLSVRGDQMPKSTS